MPQFTINPDGSKTVWSRYSRSGVLTLTAIFPNSPATSKTFIKKKKAFENENLQKKYRVHDNATLVRRIFTRFLVKMLFRVAAGDLFMMPGTTQAHITLKQIPDNEVKRLRQRGCYADYDIVKAGFKIPKFIYDFGPFSKRRDVGIYVPTTLSRYALKNAENRLIPWIHIPKTFNRDVQDD